MHAPLFPEVGVLALPYHEWDSIWMTPHYVLPRLAEYFHVVWLDPAPHWRHASLKELRPKTLTGVPPGFDVYRAKPWLPDVYRPAALRDFLCRQRVRSAWKRLDALGCTKRILHLWHPKFEAALNPRRYQIAVYHIDDEYSFSPDAPLVTAQEERVLRKVDQVFAISPDLMKRKGGINPNLQFMPEGVDSQLYMQRVAEPADLARIARPRIGYTGNLKRQLDWLMLRDLARANPKWSFVFVGPRQPIPELEHVVDELSRFDNVHMLGRKSATELAAYVQHFDVCIMPYVINNYTNSIYPLKLHEYLASGRPVVGSPIRSLLDFTHAIALARSVDEWSSALAAALTPALSSPAAVADRQQIASHYDWRRIIHGIATTMCERLDQSLAARVRALDREAAAITLRSS